MDVTTGNKARAERLCSRRASPTKNRRAHGGNKYLQVHGEIDIIFTMTIFTARTVKLEHRAGACDKADHAEAQRVIYITAFTSPNRHRNDDRVHVKREVRTASFRRGLDTSDDCGISDGCRGPSTGTTKQQPVIGEGAFEGCPKSRSRMDPRRSRMCSLRRRRIDKSNSLMPLGWWRWRTRTGELRP